MAETGGDILPRSMSAAPANRPAAMEAGAFERLYAAEAPAIHRYVRAVSGRAEIADDLVQETFVRFLTRGSRGMDAGEMRRYLFRIASNLLRDRWRSGDATAYAEPVEAGASRDLDTELDVRTALAGMKPRERELLWLAYVEGMDHAEIAAATGLQRLSVRMLLFRARGRAAKLLKPGGARG